MLTRIPERKTRKTAFTLIELLVVISIIALLIGILLPSLGQAKLSAMKVKCQANCKGITAAAHSYAADHNGKNIPDERVPSYELVNGVRTAVQGARSASLGPKVADEDELKASWFGQIENNYLSGQREAVDCPVIDDHRKSGLDDDTGLFLWYTDYVINRFGVNRSLDTADEPGRNVMFAEPNMNRESVYYIMEVVANWMWWGEDRDRMDLEQLKAGSLSFGFVDGHATRVPIKDVKNPFMEELPGVSLSAGNPPENIAYAAGNLFWWNPSDLEDPSNPTRAVFPVANDLLEGSGSN